MIEIFNGKVSELVHVIYSWSVTNNGSDFNIDIDGIALGKDLKNIIDSDDKELIVLKLSGNVVGILGLQFFSNPLGKGLIANEHYWYVVPEHRGIESIKMLKFAEDVAKDRKCSHIMMSASNLASDMHNSICRLYEKRKMKKFETVYIKEV